MKLIKVAIMGLALITFNSCNESDNDSSSVVITECNCPSRIEIDTMVNTTVEEYVAEAIGQTINIAVANTLTDVFTNFLEVLIDSDILSVTLDMLFITS